MFTDYICQAKLLYCTVFVIFKKTILLHCDCMLVSLEEAELREALDAN